MPDFKSRLPEYFLPSLLKVSTVLVIAWQGLCPLSANEETTTNERLIHQILDSWRDREHATTTLSAAWKIDHSHDRYWSSYQSDYCSSAGENSRTEIDVQSLYMKDDQLRYDFYRWHKETCFDFNGYTAQKSYEKERSIKYLAFDRMGGDFAEGPLPQLIPPHRCRSLYVDQTRTDYFQEQGAGKSFAILSRQQQYEKGVHPWLESALFRPLQLTYRPFRWTHQLTKTEPRYRILETDSNIHGRHCILLECQHSPNLHSRCWVDPQRNYLILRNILFLDGKTMEQVDIQYKQQANSEWTPDRWTLFVKSHCADFPGRSLVFQYVHCQMQELVLNPDLTNEVFQFTFPPGTYLVDTINKENRIILPDLTQRKLSAEELGGVDMMGKMPPTQRALIKDPKILAGSIAVTLAILYFYQRRRRQTDRRASAVSAPKQEDAPTP